MAYEAKTCTEVLNGETYYFLWTHQGFIVYHWDRETMSLAKISRNFFIKLENARACALENSQPANHAARLKAHIAKLQGDIEALGSHGGATE